MVEVILLICLLLYGMYCLSLPNHGQRLSNDELMKKIEQERVLREKGLL